MFAGYFLLNSICNRIKILFYSTFSPFLLVALSFRRSARRLISKVVSRLLWIEEVPEWIVKVEEFRGCWIAKVILLVYRWSFTGRKLVNITHSNKVFRATLKSTTLYQTVWLFVHVFDVVTCYYNAINIFRELHIIFITQAKHLEW